MLHAHCLQVNIYFGYSLKEPGLLLQLLLFFSMASLTDLPAVILIAGHADSVEHRYNDSFIHLKPAVTRGRFVELQTYISRHGLCC